MAKDSTSPDKAQQEAIDININAVVSAGAGSGKTRVLAKRFTDLLLRDKNCRVDQILTLTFTKKATVEMNSRIYEELSKADPEKAKDFYKANIKTLDSYCSQVARLGCHYYGVSPDFTIDADTITAKIKSMALPFTLKNRDNKAIKALVETKEFEVIASQLFAEPILKNSTVAEEIDFKKTLEAQYQVIRVQWNNSCKKLVHAYDEMIKALDDFAGNKNTVYYKGLVEACKNEPSEIPEIDFTQYESEERNAFINYFGNISAVHKSSGKGFDVIKEVHDKIKALYEKLCPLENYVYGAQYVNELVPLLEEFQQMVNHTKRSTGMLTYSDASSLALRILIDHPEIRSIEKEKYRYIMIDEFQDNNAMQRDLLFLLSEKKDRTEKSVPKPEELEKDRLFFVGDEKQSIYKFRGADVSVFRGLSKDFADGNRELKTNYRSQPALIAAFNTIFGGASYPPSKIDDTVKPCVFYTEKDEKRKISEGSSIPEYEAVYHNVEIPQKKLDEISDKEKKTLFDQRIHFAVYNSDEPVQKGFEDPDKSECYWVASKIKELLDGKYDNKKYEPNEIAILFRSYSQLPEYEKILLKEEIPFVSETVKGFFSDGPVNDIMSLLRLVAYPMDKLSFINILRSPFVNLLDNEVKAILAFDEEDKHLFDFDAEKILSEESFERYKNCQSLYQELNELVKKERIAKIISYLWYQTGYRYETLWNKNVFMYSSAYDRLFELARQADLNGTGISEFVDSIDNYQSEKEKLDGMEIPLESAQGVRIMSIHKSKGLEFPVVFICATGHKGANDSNGDVTYSSKEYGVTINTPANPVVGQKENYFFTEQKELSAKMTCAELRRVTYVALTRAETRLFITGSYSFAAFGKNDYTPDSDKKPVRILEVLMPSLMQYADFSDSEIEFSTDESCPFTFEEIPPKEISQQINSDNSRLNVKKSFKEKYDAASVIEKQEPASIYVKPSHIHESEKKPADFENEEIIVDKSVPYYQLDQIVKDSVPENKKEPEFTHANFGTIAHAYMEWGIKNEEIKVLNKEIVGLHGSEKSLKEIDRICKEMQQKFLASETGKQILESIAAGKFYKCEYSFKSLVSERIINGQIDLIYENADGSGYTIVDYKTNQHVVPEIYYAQLACYRNAISQMLGLDKSKIKCVLYYLRHASEVDITSYCDSVDLEKAVSVAE